MIRVHVPFSMDDYSSLDQLQTLPPKISAWVKKVSHLNDELNKNKNIDEHYSLIEKNKHLWRDQDLIDWLLSLSNEKCWYTETIFCGAGYPEVEHFRPKKEAKNEDGLVISNGYYWLSFNLTNYRLSKPMPNRKKGSYFPVLDESRRAMSHESCHRDERPLFLDPLVQSDCLLLGFNDNGKGVPENGCTSLQKKRVNLTVKHFGINHSFLNRRRKIVWITVRKLYAKYIGLVVQAERTKSVRTEEIAQIELEKIRELLQPTSEFSSVAKSALLKIGDDMARKIASI